MLKKKKEKQPPEQMEKIFFKKKYEKVIIHRTIYFLYLLYGYLVKCHVIHYPVSELQIF